MTGVSVDLSVLRSGIDKMNEMCYNDMTMGDCDERPPNPEEEPPSTIKKDREHLQSVNAGGLPDGIINGNHIRNVSSGEFKLVFVHHSPGCKPYLGYHNSIYLHKDD